VHKPRKCNKTKYPSDSNNIQPSPSLRTEVIETSLRKQTPARRLTQFTCRIPFGSVCFHYLGRSSVTGCKIQLGGAHKSKMAMRFHTHGILMTPLPWCAISNGTHLERKKRTDVNILSRHNSHSSLHFYISC
jgi:hypothetical protein